MHCQITYRYFNVCFVEIQLKKEKLKYIFRRQSLVAQTGIRSPKRPEYITAD